MSIDSSDIQPLVPDENCAIELSHVSLRFRKYKARGAGLKDTIINRLKGGKAPKAHDDFWLYKDLNVKIHRGERVGIIGPNGCGKSTMLKLISGVYYPTGGMVHVRGKIVPLIEVNSGLNGDLSGRENIILVGTLFGRDPKEMAEKMEEILAFAGLEKFGDTPLKYYSSGMKTRLSFSVVTDMDPEILLADEVFAVGDEDFRRKAVARMQEMMDSAHIVCLVSHQLSLIRQLTTRTIWIDGGEIINDGPTEEICDEYLASVADMPDKSKTRVIEEVAKRPHE
jgi:ABC-type polysaccharide/polyol phosphate transport system ATPase subunit